MKLKRLSRVGVVFFLVAGAAAARVRIAVQDGKRILYNDGVGSATREALRQSDDWLASRVAVSSLYDGVIAQAARENGIDPRLVKSVMLIESGFDPAAVSRKGARGLMQLMPETALRYGVNNIQDPEENVGGGARYLAYLLGLFGGDLSRSLAAYNAGEAAVTRYGGIPPYDETRLYVHKGLTAYYGRASLAGGFGRPQGQTWVRGRPVRLTRDSKNRPLITTNLSVHPLVKRS